MNLDQIVPEVLSELEKAARKFPTWPTDPLHAAAVVGEEFGELTQATLQTIYEPSKSNREEVEKEAIQTAAMIFRFLLSLDVYQYDESEQVRDISAREGVQSVDPDCTRSEAAR